VRRFNFNSGHTADLGQHTDITLQEIPKHRLTLRLFVENEERDLQTEDNLTWALVQRVYVIWFAHCVQSLKPVRM